jgi:membrane protein implicated in regulation of membrane protease activity
MLIVWVVLAVVLIAVELHHAAFYALFGALGAIAAAIVTIAVPQLIWLQVLVAFVSGSLGVRFVRPYVSRALHRDITEPVAVGVHGGLVGETVEVLDEISPEHGGHVRLVGERWLAIVEPKTGNFFTAGSSAVVSAVNGTTLTICALSTAIQPSTEIQPGAST